MKPLISLLFCVVILGCGQLKTAQPVSQTDSYSADDWWGKKKAAGIVPLPDQENVVLLRCSSSDVDNDFLNAMMDLEQYGQTQNGHCQTFGPIKGNELVRLAKALTIPENADGALIPIISVGVAGVVLAGSVVITGGLIIPITAIAAIGLGSGIAVQQVEKIRTFDTGRIVNRELAVDAEGSLALQNNIIEQTNSSTFDASFAITRCLIEKQDAEACGEMKSRLIRILNGY